MHGIALEAVTATNTEYQRIQVEIDLGCICTISLDGCRGVDPEVLDIEVNEPVILQVDINARLDQYTSICEQVRTLRIQLQQLQDDKFGPTDYTFPSCTS